MKGPSKTALKPQALTGWSWPGLASDLLTSASFLVLGCSGPHCGQKLQLSPASPSPELPATGPSCVQAQLRCREGMARGFERVFLLSLYGWGGGGEHFGLSGRSDPHSSNPLLSSTGSWAPGASILFASLLHGGYHCLGEKTRFWGAVHRSSEHPDKELPFS